MILIRANLYVTKFKGGKMKRIKRNCNRITVFLVVLLIVALLIPPLSVGAVSETNTFTEATDIIQQYRTSGTAWQALTPTTTFSSVSSIKLQTINKPYYFRYKCRDDSHGWLDPVLSTNVNEYAGWPGYPITNIAIEVYDYTGRIYDNFVVMYRARVGGSWLDWVSNGNPSVMQTIKSKFGLVGNLDTAATDAGWASRGVIQALEIRIYERVENYPAPSETAKIIDAPYIYQNYNYPNGCESVSTVMALQYAGINVSVDDFINYYLDMGSTPVVGQTGPDPNVVYCGDPRLQSGWGCYSPVIMNALDKFINVTHYTCSRLTGASLDELCNTYIDNDIPVVIWATVGMIDSSAPSYYAHWTTPEGVQISYNRKLHVLLLVGYDENNYYFNDPMHMNTNGIKYTGYSKASVERAYSILNQQSIVIVPNA